MNRRAVTLIECLVVVATIATLFGVIIAGRPFGSRRQGDAPPTTVQMVTVQHDGHWWILCRECCTHHPDCPCHGGAAEANR